MSALVGCLTAGGKIASCAHDGAQALAQHAATLLLGRFERARPPLPALYLNPLASWPGANAQGTQTGVGVVQQIQALCQPGDVLLMFSSGDAPAALQAALDAAHDKDMTVVACLTPTDTALAERLRETDVPIVVPTLRLARILEMHLLALHCLCDAVDAQLLGEQDFS